jgi:hypothetical protein
MLHRLAASARAVHASKRASVSKLVVSIGYYCPLCGSRVIVLSSEHPPETELRGEFLPSQCHCGFEQPIHISDLQTLDIWRDRLIISG